MNFALDPDRPQFIGGPGIVKEIPLGMIDRMHTAHKLLEEIEGELKEKRWGNEPAYWRAIYKVREAMQKLRETEIILEGVE